MGFKAFAGFGAVLFMLSCGTDVERTLATGSSSGGSSATLKVSPLRFNPPEGIYPSAQTVLVLVDTAAVNIYCTQDGTEPTVSSTFYTGRIEITQTTLLRCRGFRNDMLPSDIAQAVYVIQGSPPNQLFHTVRIEMNFSVDAEDVIRIQNGIMDLIHVKGEVPAVNPNAPVVIITRAGGSAQAFNNWSLSSFHVETGITCNLSGGCVSTPLDLGLTDLAAGGFAYISSSVIKDVGRGSVVVTGPNTIDISDPAASRSLYEFDFEYSYLATSK